MAALAIASVFTLAACTGSTPGTDGGPDSDALRLAFLDGISIPDPDSAYDGAELNLVNNAYEGLLTYEPGKAEPTLRGVLATDWEVSNDNTTYTFDLREDVVFHDGTPFTSEAVQASFERRMDVGEGPAYMVSGVSSVDTTSDYKVVITLNAPDSSFLALLASPFGPKMVSPSAISDHPVDDNADNWFATNSAGTGPYMYTGFREGIQYGLAAFDNYWGEAPAYGAITFTVESNMSGIQLKLRSGELDGLIGYSDRATFDSFSSEDSLKTYTFPSMQTPTLFLNPLRPGLDDQQTRRDLIAGIDFAELASAALGSTGEPISTMFPERLLPEELNQQQIPQDPDALQRLADGAFESRTVTIAYSATSPPARDMSENLAARLNAAGINTETIGFASGTFYSGLENGKDSPDLSIFTGFPDTADPYAWGSVFYTPGGGLDLFAADVPGLAEILDQARADGDLEKYGQASRMVSESGYWQSVATMLGTAVFQLSIDGVDNAWNPVITGLFDLTELRPMDDE